MRRALVFALLLVTGAPARVAAQQAIVPATGLTLDAALERARRSNADLLVARSVADSARAEARIARAFPNPVIAAIPNVPFQYSVTLPLDVGPQRRSRVRVGALAEDATRYDVHDAERQLELAVARAWYDVLLADAKRTIAEQRRTAVRQIVAADSARVAAGDLPERALARSQVELLRADADAARSGIDALGTRLALQGLMGVASPDSALRLDGSLAYRATAVEEVAHEMAAAQRRRPDVAAARVREEQAMAAQRLAATAVVPTPQLSYVRQFSGPFESGHYWAFGVGVELPLLNQYGGQRDRAAAGREAARVARQRIEAQARREITMASVDLGAQRVLVEHYEGGVIDAVERNATATRYAYARGAASLLELLDALR
ncbi:MAG: outer rane efflux family protein, partial [Gemmatimonadetes bacterium]|nr:outer rane efflux family protein [Gemmatimonadota bacterium]